MKKVLLVILDQYADWEAALVAAAVNDPEGTEKKYEVKTVSLSGEPVKSIGGFTTLPDYDLVSAPKDAAAVLLVGGMSWRKPEAVPVAEFVRQARQRGALIGAICDATVFLGMHGFLNDVRHTSNQLESLKRAAGDAYTNEEHYVLEQAISDGGVITANGTAHMEFAREVLIALNVMPLEKTDEWYDFFKLGYYDAMKKHQKS